jgi:hypothetical protein
VAAPVKHTPPNAVGRQDEVIAQLFDVLLSLPAVGRVGHLAALVLLTEHSEHSVDFAVPVPLACTQDDVRLIDHGLAPAVVTGLAAVRVIAQPADGRGVLMRPEKILDCHQTFSHVSPQQ